MLNNEDNDKNKLVVDFFLENPTSSMIAISGSIGVSKSTVQRILNKECFSSIIIPSTGRTIKEQLAHNLSMGKKKGGKNSFQYNTAIKDENGKFVGSVFNYDYIDHEAIKQQNIELIVKYYCYNPNETLEDIVEQINKLYDKEFTKAYVYDCLLDSRVEALFGPIVSEEIKNQLSYNVQGFFRKFGFISMDENTLSMYNLNEREIAVLLYRFNDGKLKSTQETAEYFNCSKTVITKIENSALKKINTICEEEVSKTR